MPNRFSGGESVQHWLAVDKVRFCGEAVCAVVAEDRAIAEDAAELIDVGYEPLPVVTDPRRGEEDGAALIHDSCPNNHLIKREFERGKVDEALAAAHLVVKRKFKIGRKQALCLESRGCGRLSGKHVRPDSVESAASCPMSCVTTSPIICVWRKTTFVSSSPIPEAASARKPRSIRKSLSALFSR